MGARAVKAPRLAMQAALGIAALTAGCAAGPDYRPPEAPGVPAAYVGPGIVTPAAPWDRWWLAFGDPTLNALIVRALAGNPDLGAAEAQVAGARAPRAPWAPASGRAPGGR